MKTTIDTKTAGQITIDSEYVGNKLWDASDKTQNYNNHLVTVTNNKKKYSFDFWGSINSPEISNDEENIFAFYCSLSDALAGEQSFEEFCGEFGYDNDSIKALKTHKACKKTFNKVEKVFDCELYELINEIQETYNC